MRNRVWQLGAGAVGAGALLAATACGGGDVMSLRAQEQTAGAGGAPVLVSCEPHQRALVRSTVVNGAAVSQVECVSTGMTAAYADPRGFGQAQPILAADGRVVPAAYPAYPPTVIASPAPRARPVAQRVVVERPRSTRSVKKSAIIIGSSAGVGAGVGAAVGGKKGALIGAAIGGGSAAIWDQVTRR
jgi:hypothetical protein